MNTNKLSKHKAFSAMNTAKNETPHSLLDNKEPSSIKNQRATTIDIDIQDKLQINADLNL